MKKAICIIAALAMLTAFSACGKTAESSTPMITKESTTGKTETEKTTFHLASVDKDDESTTTTFRAEQADSADGRLCGYFIIKEIRGTLVTMAKYDRDAGKPEDGLYRGNIGLADPPYKVGDTVIAVYDSEIEETYPYGITIREIRPASFDSDPLPFESQEDEASQSKRAEVFNRVQNEIYG